MEAFNNKNYSEAKKYLSKLVEKDPHIQEAQQIIEEIQKITQVVPTKIPKIPTLTKNQVSENTNKSVPANYNYSEIGKDYISKSGLTIILNTINKSEESGSNNYLITYTQENKKTDKEISEISFALIFEDETRLSQYGFFNSIFPGEIKSKSYSFKTLKTQKAVAIELVDDFNQNKQDSLKWRIPN
jgi:hypothetical protein